MTITDTSREAAEAISAKIGDLANVEAKSMISGWEDAVSLYLDTVDFIAAILAERDALRAQLAAARNEALEEAAK